MKALILAIALLLGCACAASAQEFVCGPTGCYQVYRPTPVRTFIARQPVRTIILTPIIYRPGYLIPRLHRVYYWW